MNIPIVIAAYNRDHTLSRLLSSLAKAHYTESVKLIISIDGNGPDSVMQVAKDFTWPHGPKEIIRHSENLGLRRHILSCGALSQLYDGIILLEDDLYVSPHFYEYTQAALSFYRHSPMICGLSLYSYRYNETACLPFTPLDDGSDTYFMQLPCSWGQAWLKEHWQEFSAWYELHADENPQNDSALPPNIAFWPDTSWKKYFLKYMVDTNKFFVYPRNSYTTNFGDKGQHHQGTDVFQVSLVFENKRVFCFSDFSASSVKYDVHCELLPECLINLSGHDLPASLTVDLYGSKSVANMTSDYVITPKRGHGFVKSFALRMQPHELNIIERIEGNELYLTRLEDLDEFREVNQFIHRRANREATQRYYFGTEEVHFARLRELERSLEQAKERIRLLSGESVALQNFVDSLETCKADLQEIKDSRSWRLTRPLRWLGNLVKALAR